jgi:hypothetical protein
MQNGVNNIKYNNDGLEWYYLRTLDIQGYYKINRHFQLFIETKSLKI